MKLVIDASVAIKWVLQHAPDEQDVDVALALLGEIEAGTHSMIQPPHWLPEVLAVLARRAPDLIVDGFDFFRDLSSEAAADDAIYLRAADLSHRLKQHLFDTLYHAVAIERGATLVTADERYFNAAVQEGSIQLLHRFQAV